MGVVTLHIDAPDGEHTVSLDEELSIGRSDISQIILNDSGLSRKNTTFFRDGEDILVVDEDSTNGTFLNGQQIKGQPRILRNGDEIKIGNSTRIRVMFGAAREVGENRKSVEEKHPIDTFPAEGDSKAPADKPLQSSQRSILRLNLQDPKTLLFAAGMMTFLIIFVGLVTILIVQQYRNGTTVASNNVLKPPVMTAKVIPMRVIDPLGGEDEESLDDLIASWEAEEKEIDAKNVDDVAVDPANAEEADLNVTAAFLADRQKKAFEARPGEKGIRPAGLAVPKELFGDGVIKQKAKLREMNSGGYKQPLDFAELAEKRLSGELLEMPMATNSFYLDVGGSASDGPFKTFSFSQEPVEITSGMPKYATLAKLASNFAGQKYDLNNAGNRKQMRMRLLRMFQRRAKPILRELADAYFQKFGRPLRVTSLTRSMDYQIGLNATNANSFKVRGEGSLPPHTSGCAFDLARKHMPVDEQNFVMNKLAEMERANKLDALIEYGDNACFHVFIYSDGIPPKM